VKKSILDKYGYFDLRFKISADYELILRLLEKYNIATTYLPKVIAKMRVGGESNKNIFNIWKANVECYKAWKANGLNINIFQYLLKPVIKASQYIFK
jgi:glycosyltransferase